MERRTIITVLRTTRFVISPRGGGGGGGGGVARKTVCTLSSNIVQLN